MVYLQHAFSDPVRADLSSGDFVLLLDDMKELIRLIHDYTSLNRTGKKVFIHTLSYTPMSTLLSKLYTLIYPIS